VTTTTARVGKRSDQATKTGIFPDLKLRYALKPKQLDAEIEYEATNAARSWSNPVESIMRPLF
jgi:hypothetical protein